MQSFGLTSGPHIMLEEIDRAGCLPSTRRRTGRTRGRSQAALSAEMTSQLVELFKAPPAGEEETLLELITDRVPPGVDEAAYVKAAFLSAIVRGEAASPLIDRRHAIVLLGGMHGGYNIATLVDALDDDELAEQAATELKHTLLMFDAFHDVAEKSSNGNSHAAKVLQSWADAQWFTDRERVPESIKTTVFKVPGETNTDDLSPAPDAWSRPDIPLHALAMYKMKRDGLEPDVPGTIGPLKQIEAMKAKGYPVALVGDVVGTGSSRKSATNSVLWFFGDDIAGVPNKRGGGICIGNKCGTNLLQHHGGRRRAGLRGARRSVEYGRCRGDTAL